MVNRIVFIFAVIILTHGGQVFSQISPSSSMFFVNLYQINPSYAGLEGRPVFNLSHRQQWVGVDGAPVTTRLTFDMPIKYGVSAGAEIYSDERSILRTNSVTFTVGYAVQFSPKSSLRFGLSGGVGFRNIDFDQIENPSDPAIQDAIDNNAYLDGNFGLSFQSGYFLFGVALPNFFEPNLNNTSSFENGNFKPLDEILFNASYRFYFALDDMFFEPSLIYRLNQVMPDQFEVAGIFYLKNLLWFGGSYRQDYGATAMLGLTLNKQFMIGYSYGIGSAKLPGIGASTHEIHLSIALGKRNQKSSASSEIFVSYVDTDRVYPDQRVKQQKETKAISKVTPVTPIIVEIEEPVKEEEEQEAREDVRTSEHDDPRLVMSRGRKASNVTTIRSETVYEGISDFELPKGNYIIVGEYKDESGARQFYTRLGNEGYRAEFGYVSRKRMWMVYIYRSDSKIGFRKKVLETRSNPDFKDAWILSVL
jgi:type IX secretion system PorP/SprF family membrane protein